MTQRAPSTGPRLAAALERLVPAVALVDPRGSELEGAAVAAAADGDDAAVVAAPPNARHVAAVPHALPILRPATNCPPRHHTHYGPSLLKPSLRF